MIKFFKRSQVLTNALRKHELPNKGSDETWISAQPMVSSESKNHRPSTEWIRYLFLNVLGLVPPPLRWAFQDGSGGSHSPIKTAPIEKKIYKICLSCLEAQIFWHLFSHSRLWYGFSPRKSTFWLSGIAFRAPFDSNGPSLQLARDSDSRQCVTHLNICGDDPSHGLQRVISTRGLTILGETVLPLEMASLYLLSTLPALLTEAAIW